MSPYLCKIDLTITNGSTTTQIEIKNIPQPDEDGVFEVDNKKLVVIPLALSPELDKAEIQCVGEQLYDFIKPRLGGGNSNLHINEWVREFLDPKERPQVMYLQDRNWFSRCEHLRRIMIKSSQYPEITKAHFGRVCPILTPEGYNIGRLLSIARDAHIRRGKIVPSTTKTPPLSVTASMIPLIEHNDPNRAMIGANLMRLWLVLPNPEPALVQTGNEPDVPEFWCGRNLLTAFISLGENTFYDGIVISESCATRLCFDGIIEPGDKISNRHGTKGVISQILPDEEMPHLSDGTPVELVFSFSALHARLNYGQIREALLSRIAVKEGRPVICPPFRGPSEEEIRHKLKENGLPESGMEFLRIGKNGVSLKYPSTVGWVYWGVTQHLVRDKLQVTPNMFEKSQKTMGQRRSEKEYWMLRDVGAFENIIESFNLCSCERIEGKELAKQIAKGKITISSPPTPMFMWLKRRLSAGGIRMDFDGKKINFTFSPPMGKKLSLASFVSHPWLPNRKLKEIGVIPEVLGYQELIKANDKLQHLLSENAPSKLIAHSQDNLQRAVEKFFKNLLSYKDKKHITINGHVNFSGRSVAIPGKDLRIDQVGLPDTIAWSLFGPFVAYEIGSEEDVINRSKEAIKRIDKIMSKSWIILHRAPTITKTSSLAFHPVRIPGKAIQLHPLVCRLMNADFDGDQVAVFLPITPTAQKEAGEKLSIIGHIRRDPTLIRLLCPTGEALWGLANLSLNTKGRRKIKEIIGIDITGSDGFVTESSIAEGMEKVLRDKGEQKAMEILEALTRLGFDVAKHSGASLNPFVKELQFSPPLSKNLDFEACEEIVSEMENIVVSSKDYDSLVLGPQLLSVKCGAQGKSSHIYNLTNGGIVVDMDGNFMLVPHGFAKGLEVYEWFCWAYKERKELYQVVEYTIQIEKELHKTCSPKGFSVLARAMRLDCPGKVFARAAEIGETEPLIDKDARLFVGLRPKS